MVKASNIQFRDLSPEEFTNKFREQFPSLQRPYRMVLPTMEELMAREYNEEAREFNYSN